MDTKISFSMLSSQEILKELSSRLRSRRLARNLTQNGLARRSGVALGTLKKFESTGHVSLASFVRLAVALKDEAALEGLLLEEEFRTLDDVLRAERKPRRGRIT